MNISDADVKLDATPTSQAPLSIPDSAVTLDEDKYGTPGQQAIAGLEGATRGIAGPVATAIEKNYYRVPSQDIQGRQEANPVTSGIGEGMGLGIGAITGTGEGALLSKAGEAATAATNLAEPATLAAKIGSSAVKQAAEMALYQTGDEASKAMLDPTLTAESAIMNIGLATAIGGTAGAAFGAVSPLWRATIGARTDDALKALSSKLGGIEGDIGGTAANLEAQAGVSIPPELKGVIDDIPGYRENHSVLSQRDTTMAGRAYQNSLRELNDSLADKVITSLGKDPKTIDSLPELDKYNAGRVAGETLHSELKPLAEDIANRYDYTNNKFTKSLLGPEDARLIADQITQKGLEQGWQKAKSVSSNFALAEKVLKDIPEQKNVGDLKKFITNLRNSNPYGSDTYQAAKDIGNILKDNQERIISKNMGPEEVTRYAQLRKDYSTLMGTIDNLNEHLHVGKYDGPQSFLQALKEQSRDSGETLINRLSGTNRAEVLDQLKPFPQTLEKIKNWHVDKLLDTAVKRAQPDTKINVNNLIKNASEFSPQIKSLIATPEQHQAINASAQILDKLKDPTHNFSNSARTVEKLLHGTPSALSLLAALTGHTGTGVLSFLGKLGFTEGKDALKLGMMKFLASDKPVQAEGFKSMVSVMKASLKSMNTISEASKNVFRPGVKSIIEQANPEQIEKLDKLVSSNDPKDMHKEMIAQNGGLGHYMPEHQTAMTQTSLNSLNYLKSLKPQPTSTSPLARETEPSAMQEMKYNKALQIAVNPGIVLQHIKDGTLTGSEVQHIQVMYPALAQHMKQQLTNEMIAAKSEGTIIPSATKRGMSLFLGQPMINSLTPQGIMAAQPPPPQPQQQQNAPMKGRKGKTAIDKAPNMYRTASQSAEQDRSGRD